MIFKREGLLSILKKGCSKISYQLQNLSGKLSKEVSTIGIFSVAYFEYFIRYYLIRQRFGHKNANFKPKMSKINWLENLNKISKQRIFASLNF